MADHLMLPMVPASPHHGRRDPMTCRYRCGNACAQEVPNQSGNTYFGDLLSAAWSRRSVLALGAGASVLLTTGCGGHTGAAAAAAVPGPSAGHHDGLTFTPVAPSVEDTVVVAAGYQHTVLVRWGDEVVPGAPPFDPQRQTAEAQARQFGYNNDFLAVLPVGSGNRRALLVGNHEYTNPELMFAGFTVPTVEQMRIQLAAIGMFVVEIERVGRTGEWRLVRSGKRPWNRRVSTSGTRFTLTGPAAGAPLLRTAADPRGRTVIGTQANCSGGVTPWRTVLSGEENITYMFVGADQAPEAEKPALRRYGFDTSARGGPSAELAAERFDLAKHPHEANRFGWVVELDPYDPRSTPRKHTALGRFKHEAANVVIGPSGRAVVYMGDDDRFEYIYKFVSDGVFDAGPGQAARRHNMTLLESGSLFVASFQGTSAAEIDGSGKLPSDGAFDGSGRWIPLTRSGRSAVAGMSIDEVLVNTRLAADAAGATRMDRPEDVQASPLTGKVYCALTNNSYRGGAGPAFAADEANPRNANKHGHILEITETDGDHEAETFGWSLPIVCGDPADPSTYFAGFDKSRVSPISCPDNLAFDSRGNLWIATDSARSLSANDGLYATALDGPDAGQVKQFLSAPVGAEVCGPVITEDGRSVLVAVQHPGETTGSTSENPSSRWPDGALPRPSVVVVWHPDGAAIGT